MKQEQLIKSASYASIGIAILILNVKFYAWVKTDSYSIFASLVDALLDVSSSIVNAVAIHISLIPPDDNHRFGHNKVEDLAIFAQSIVFFGTGVFTMFSALKGMSSHHEVLDHDLGIYIMLICIFLTGILISYQIFVIRKTASNIIQADYLHYVVDFASNIAVIISIYLSKYMSSIDNIFAIAIALYIIHGSYKLFRKAIKNLIDEEFSIQARQKIIDTLKKNSDILGVHELKTRSAGNKSFIQCHIELEKEISFMKAHNITEKVTNELLNLFPNTEVIIHPDPKGIETNFMYEEKI